MDRMRMVVSRNVVPVIVVILTLICVGGSSEFVVVSGWQNKQQAEPNGGSNKASTPKNQSQSDGSAVVRQNGSGNTAIIGNNNTVTVNPPITPAQSPQPRFRQGSDTISLSLGGITFTRRIGNLNPFQVWEPFIMRGPVDSPRFSISADGNTLLVNATVGGGPFGPIIEIQDNVITVREPSLDENWNEDALEVVNANQQPVFQLVFGNQNHISIYGYFPVSGQGPLLLDKNGMIGNANNQQIANFHLNPIFKYPAWKYPGKLAESNNSN